MKTRIRCPLFVGDARCLGGEQIGVMKKTEPDIDALVQKIEKIPTLPIISKKIMEITGDEQASFKKLVGIIEKDQTLAVKMLKIANSAFYGFVSKVSSLEHALVVLGTNQVKSIVLGSSVYSFFSKSETTNFDRTRFWKHAIICSQVATFLGKHFKIRKDDSLFLAGLIHDVGKVVLDQYFPDEFLRIVDHVSSAGTTFSDAEGKILGTTHYQVAAKLLKQWKFPDRVIMQVLYHHAPWYDIHFTTNSKIIYLANIFTKLAGYACHPDEKAIDLHELADSPEIGFVREGGFPLDYETIEELNRRIRESILQEADNVMELFK
jgi:putative nucleotidyltransferase with HDIG domain